MKIIVITYALVLATLGMNGWAAALDDDFAAKAAKGGATEVKAGELARSKGMSPAVKEFGEHMVKDHSKAATGLEAAARKDDVGIAVDAKTPDPAAVEMLSKLEGHPFDVAYAKMMVADHEQTVALFEKQHTEGSGELKAFAGKTLPTLRAHLDMAKALHTSMSTK